MVIRRIPLPEGVAGSLPPISDLMRLTGPIEREALQLIIENGGPLPKILNTFAPMADDEVAYMMFAMIWLLRGRNGLLEHNETLFT